MIGKRSNLRLLQRTEWSFYLIRLCWAVLLSFLFACSAPLKSKGFHDYRKVVTRYWQERLFGRDVRLLYSLEWPPSRPTLELYQKRVFAIQKFKIVRFDLGPAVRKGNRLHLEIEVYFFLPGAPISPRKPFKQTIKDEWVLTPKGWRHVWHFG